MGVVLVTGGAGYIGSHVVKALLRTGRSVVVFDDLSAGHRAAVGQASFVEGDINNTTAVEETIRKHGVTAVMHFAAWLNVPESMNNPAGYYRANVTGALSVLDAMARVSVNRFVFSSSCAVYGNPIETPITEFHPTEPINPYGETKLAVERALPHYERAYGLRSITLRYFNAAGADPEGELGEDHDPEVHLIPRVVEAVRGGPSLCVFGEDYPTPDGTCQRDYIHVTDLAQAHVLALEALEASGTSAVYNLGNGRPSSVREVIAAVERVTRRRVAWRSASRRPGDPSVLFASSDKAKKELGWRPGFSDLDAIVETAWRWREAHPRGFDDRRQS